MASSRGSGPARRRTADAHGPRPLSPYPERIDDPSLEAVVRPLLSRAEPGAERAADLERARARLVDQARPADAAVIAALLDEAALDLGEPPAKERPQPPRTATERQRRARAEQARAARLEYLSVLLTAACLHPASQRRVAAVLTGPHEAVVRERAALRAALSPAPLSAPLERALRRVLDRAPRAPSAPERNLLSNAASALRRHLPAAAALEALRGHLEPAALEAPGGVARAQMILADLDAEHLDPGWRQALGSLLRQPALASLAGELLGQGEVSADEGRLAASALAAQLDRGEPPDGHLVWLLTHAPPAGAEALLLRLLDASAEPDWAVLLEGLTRLLPAVSDLPALGQALGRWAEEHRRRTGRPASWEGYEAARSIARALARGASR